MKKFISVLLSLCLFSSSISFGAYKWVNPYTNQPDYYLSVADLNPSLIPYTGAKYNINIGTHTLTTTGDIIFPRWVENVSGSNLYIEYNNIIHRFMVNGGLSGSFYSDNFYNYLGTVYFDTTSNPWVLRDAAIGATNFESYVAIGTQPYACISTTLNTNLNADLWDGYHFSSYFDQPVKTNSNVLFGTIGTGVGTLSGGNGNAAFTLLNLNNTANPATGNTGQTSDLIFNLMGTINSGSTFVSHEAAKISAYKISDWWHASTEADHDSGLKFYTTSNGTPTLQLTIADTGNLLLPTGKWVGLGAAAGRIYFLDAATDLVEVSGATFAVDTKIGINTTAPAAPLHIMTYPAGTSEASRIEGYTNTGLGPTQDLYKTYKTIWATTSNSVVTMQTYTLGTGEMCIIKALIVAVEEGNGGAYVGYDLTAFVDNPAGTAALLDSVTKIAGENAAGGACDATITVSGATALIRITGLAAKNMAWSSTVMVQSAWTGWQGEP
jgi:hypothetical protein